MPKSTEKPPLSLAATSETALSPSRPLGPHGQKLWDEVQWQYRISDAGGVATLMQACASLDRAEELSEVIAREGLVIGTGAGPKSHPCIKDELGCRAFVCRALHLLGLCVPVTPARGPGRPPKQFTW